MKKLITAIFLLTAMLTTSAYAVKHVNVKVPVDKNGMTSEQVNIADRTITDNKVGSIKHLYVISAYSGDVLIYSTVRGKVTSSGKRLQPKTVATGDGQAVSSIFQANKVNINGRKYVSNEVMGDDGAYGDSIPYLYWWDTKGVYHQHYVTGGQIPHLSDQPIAVEKVILNFETSSSF